MVGAYKICIVLGILIFFGVSYYYYYFVGPGESKKRIVMMEIDSHICLIEYTPISFSLRYKNFSRFYFRVMLFINFCQVYFIKMYDYHIIISHLTSAFDICVFISFFFFLTYLNSFILQYIIENMKDNPPKLIQELELDETEAELEERNKNLLYFMSVYIIVYTLQLFLLVFSSGLYC